MITVLYMGANTEPAEYEEVIQSSHMNCISAAETASTTAC